MKIGNTVKRFDNLYLTSFTDRIIQIPDSVSAIGHSCFEYSNALINGIPKSVVEIGEDAFNGFSEYSWGSDKLLFFNRTIEEVQDITDANGIKQYPWGLSEDKISAEYS